MSSLEVNTFLEWARSKGALHDNVEMKDFGHFGLGGELLKDLQADESILSISLDIMINSKVVLKHEFGKKLQRIYEDTKEFQGCISKVQKDEKDGSVLNNAENFGFPMVALYIFLVHERKNKDSFWKLYFPTLPKTYNTPLYFSQQDEEMLKGSNLYLSTRGIKDRLGSLYNGLFPLLTRIDPSIQCTYEELRWAYSTVWSRAFPIKYGEEVIPSLLPVISILNHQYGAKMTYFTDPEENRFHLKTQVPLKKGGQVFNNYGGKSNESFLYSYGFVVENNTEDTLYVQIGMKEQDPDFANAKVKHLADNNLKMGYYIRRDGFPEDFIKTIKVCVMNQEDFYFGASLRCQVELLLVLRNLFLDKLSKFPTTIEEDKVEINKEKEYRTHCILTYLIGQKEILESSLKRIDALELELCNGNDKPIINQDKEMLTEKFYSTHSLQWTKKDPIKMVSKQQVVAGSILYSSPTITLEEAKKSEIGHLLQFDPETNMLIYLLHLRFDTKSQWQPFFTQLPLQFSTPLYMQDHSLLEGTPAFDEVMNIIDHLQDVVMSILPRLSKSSLASHINLNNLRWAFTVYTQFSHQGQIIPNPAVMPFSNSRMVVSSLHAGKYQLKTLVDLDQNEVIASCVPAMGMTNHELLVNYGYIIPNNSNDFFPILLDPENMSMDIIRIHIIQEMGLGFEHFIKKDIIPLKLIQVFKIHLMTESEFDTFKVVKEIPGSIENQEDIAGCIEEILLETLNSLPLIPKNKTKNPIEIACIHYLQEMMQIVENNIETMKKLY